MKHLVLGIDPGAKGAVVVMDVDTSVVIEAYDYPKTGGAHQLWQILNAAMPGWEAGVSLVCLEEQHAFPGQAKTNFSMGTNYGIWQGVCAAMLWPLIKVSVHTWRKAVLDSSVPKKPDKCHIVDFAKRRWPTCSFTTNRGSDLDGRAEAACMAEYARQILVGRIVQDKPKKSVRKRQSTKT